MGGGPAGDGNRARDRISSIDGCVNPSNSRTESQGQIQSRTKLFNRAGALALSCAIVRRGTVLRFGRSIRLQYPTQTPASIYVDRLGNGGNSTGDSAGHMDGVGDGWFLVGLLNHHYGHQAGVHVQGGTLSRAHL